MHVTDVVRKTPSLIFGIARTCEKLVFSDAQDYTINFCCEGNISKTLGSSPSSLASCGESVLVCDTNNKALRLVSSLQSYKRLGIKINAFIELFQLNKDVPYSVESVSLQDGIAVLENVKTAMKDIERNANYRTGKRCPQGPDLAFTKPTRNSFEMLYKSFKGIDDYLQDNNLLHLLDELSFASFTTLDVEHFFFSMRTPSRPTSDMSDYAIRRQMCILESVEKTYQSSFVFYTGPQSHYKKRTVKLKEPEWLRGRENQREHSTAAASVQNENDEANKERQKEEVRGMQSFAKEFGRGVRQQRVRGKTKERAGTLPLALSMAR